MSLAIVPLLGHHGQFDELLHGQLLGTQGEDGLVEVRIVRPEDRPDGVAQGLASLIECGLDHGLERALATSQRGASIAHESDDAALDLGRGIKYVFVDSE